MLSLRLISPAPVLAVVPLVLIRLDEVSAAAVLREVAAAIRLGDERALNELRARVGDRLPQGRSAEVFRMLTAPKIQASADLPRLAGELNRARGTLGLATALK